MILNMSVLASFVSSLIPILLANFLFWNMPSLGNLDFKNPQVAQGYILKFKVTVLEKLNSINFYFYPAEKENYLKSRDINKLSGKADDVQLGLLIKQFGPEAVMRQLYAQSDQGKNYNCHVPAHKIGRISHTLLGDKTLAQNITLCASGYEHGVMAGFVGALSEKEVISKINEKCGSLNPLFLRINCFHGAGHGLMAYYDYDLPKVIKSCKNLNEYSRTGNCLAGAFMENIRTQFGDSLSIHDTKWLDRNDPHFPCNKIDQDRQVQTKCYTMQAGWMTHLFDNDLNKTVTACLEVSKDIVDDCFFGYGQMVGLKTNYNPAMSIILCQLVPEGIHRDSCYHGTLMDIVYFWGSNLGNKGNAFCQALPSTDQPACKKFLDERIVNLNK